MRLIAFLIMVAIVPMANAVPIFSPVDAILGGQRVGANFEVGTTGFMSGVNNWPGVESPDHLIDGVGQKYLNFGEFDTGAIITPTLGSSITDSIKFWTANDAIARDPSQYELWGTNDSIIGTSIGLSIFSIISSGNLSLPASRNGGGSTPLDDANSQTVLFANSTAYSSYLLLFPDVKNSANANSMQLAEAQLFGTAAPSVPEPASLAMMGLGLLAGIRFRRRRTVRSPQIKK